MSPVILSAGNARNSTAEYGGMAVAQASHEGAKPMNFTHFGETASLRQESGRNRDEYRNFQVLRRLKGFVVDNQGDSWRVAFVEGGKKIFYDLPAEKLQRASVTERFQPFQMDELEPISSELSGRLYRFKALAGADSASIETLPLDPERQRKRDLIWEKCGNAQG